MTPRIAAVILAAGAGRRMGAPKALVLLDGRTFLARALETAAAAGLAEPIVVLDPRASIFPEASRIARDAGARVVENADADRGMLSSIRAGLAALAPEITHAALWPVDHPRVRAATVARLVDELARTPASIVVPSFEGRRGHPAFFPRDLFDALSRAPESEGARAVLAANANRIAHVVVDDPGVVRDVDTPADLR